MQRGWLSVENTNGSLQTISGYMRSSYMTCHISGKFSIDNLLCSVDGPSDSSVAYSPVGRNCIAFQDSGSMDPTVQDPPSLQDPPSRTNRRPPHRRQRHHRRRRNRHCLPRPCRPLVDCSVWHPHCLTACCLFYITGTGRQGLWMTACLACDRPCGCSGCFVCFRVPAGGSLRSGHFHLWFPHFHLVALPMGNFGLVVLVFELVLLCACASLCASRRGDVSKPVASNRASHPDCSTRGDSSNSFSPPR